MSREARAVEDGAIYHVTARGNNKVKVFQVTYDYKKYIDNLKKYKIKYHYKLYAYVLMPNHVHLLVEPVSGKELSLIMRSLNLSYARWHHRRYDCVGHLWQGRFSSRIMTSDEYLLKCMAYIDLNPVKAGLSTRPVDYKWGSFAERFSNKKSDILDNHPVFLSLAKTKKERRYTYEKILF